MSEERPTFCTSFIANEDWDWIPCRCPACNGFLPRDFPLHGQFQCKKCSSVLECMPNSDPDLEDDEQDDDMEFGGRICLVPEGSITMEVVDYKERRKKRGRVRKHKTNKWATVLGFTRRVWSRNGVEFIEVNGESIPLTDKRVLMVNE